MASISHVFMAFVIVLVQTCLALEGYEGHELISVTPRTTKHIDYLDHVQIEYGELDFWNHPMLNESNYILVPPHLLAIFKGLLEDNDIEWTVESTDIAGLIEESEGRNLITVQGQASIDSFHAQYHGYDELMNYLRKLKKKYPENMEISNMGHTTHQGRKVVLVKLTGRNSSDGSEKRSIIVEGGMHAREWISPAANVYAIQKMLKGYKANSRAEKVMLEKYDWYFVPVTNPDGYEYSRTNNRLWRKNMRRISSSCFGVDLNRNFDIQFGRASTSQDCRSLVYPGTGPFTEPETLNLRDLFLSLKDSLISYLSVHSYAQVILLPWSYGSNNETPPNYDELKRVAKRMVKEIREIEKREYTYGTAKSTIQYAASGTSSDWALATKPGIYSMCMELRPQHRSRNGFLLPPKEIIPAAKEYFASLKVLAKQMKS